MECGKWANDLIISMLENQTAKVIALLSVGTEIKQKITPDHQLPNEV